MSKLGDRLKKLRAGKGLSVAEVARQLDISQSTYRDWEYGRSIIGEPYEGLAKVFNVTIGEILRGTPHDIESELREIEILVKNIRQKL